MRSLAANVACVLLAESGDVTVIWCLL